MEQRELKQMLEGVRNGDIAVEEAVKALKMEPFEDLGFAKIDHHRAIRQGAAEVIYGAGKTPEHIAGIVEAMLAKGQKRILITRMSAEAAEFVGKRLEVMGCQDDESGAENSAFGKDAVAPAARCHDESGTEDSVFGKSAVALAARCHGDESEVGDSANCMIPKLQYDSLAKIGIVGEFPEPDGIGTVVVATGGTSDIPIAEEAAKTAEILGSRVVRLFDVGVSGLHRLMAHREEIMTAEVIVAVAGMEGALASVIGGLADCPVIAVPTSVGYGASFGGVSALLSMLNSCASGVSVVNIDNGFGAGYLANMINHRRI